MDSQRYALPVHFIAIAMLLAALLTGFVCCLLLRAWIGAHDEEILAVAVTAVTINALLIVPSGTALAIRRLRDPAATLDSWAATGAAAGLLTGIGLNLIVLLVHLRVNAVDPLPLWVIGIFLFAAINGALTASIARALTLRFARSQR